MEKKQEDKNICPKCGEIKILNSTLFTADCMCTNPKGYPVMSFLADKGDKEKECK